MAIERTFSILKPDATERNLTGRYQCRDRESGLADRCPEAHANFSWCRCWKETTRSRSIAKSWERLIRPRRQQEPFASFMRDRSRKIPCMAQMRPIQRRARLLSSFQRMRLSARVDAPYRSGVEEPGSRSKIRRHLPPREPLMVRSRNLVGVLTLTDTRKTGGGPMPRTLIQPNKNDNRYVRRKKGKFTKSQDDVGRSLAADRRQHAKRKVKSGEGDRGDR
jgi:hypothetical protein